MLSKSAFNAMLKTLEEPSAHVVFILATTDPEKLPITVISRCIQLKLSYISIDDITEYLKNILYIENIQFEEKAIIEIANSAKGSMRDALSILDQAISYMPSIINIDGINTMLGITDDQYIAKIIDKIILLDPSGLNLEAIQLYKNGFNLENVLIKLADIFSKILIMQLTNCNYNNWIDRYKDQINMNDLQLYFEICNLGLEQIKKIDNRYSVFVMTLMRMLVFRIGDQQEEDNLLNLSVDKKKIVENEIVVIKDDNFNSFTDNKETLVIEKNEDNVSVISNNDDWINKIKVNKNVFGSLFSFVSNSKYVSYSDNVLSLLMEKRYKNSLSHNIQIKLEEILGKIFDKKCELEILYEENLINTLHWYLGEQTKLEKAELIEFLENDQKLVTLLDKFSGIILASSIKKV
jgi:DNA polymerase-3 subunit gamma/tau